jgi:hypothetical protein
MTRFAPYLYSTDSDDSRRSRVYVSLVSIALLRYSLAPSNRAMSHTTHMSPKAEAVMHHTLFVFGQRGSARNVSGCSVEVVGASIDGVAVCLGAARVWCGYYVD